MFEFRYIDKQAKNKYLLFVDFKAAFDSVPHERIMKELYKYNIYSKTLNIVKFLLNSYRTSIDGEIIININRGVP